LDFLAQRVETDRVRERDPRRLFLHDHLRLSAELRAIGLLWRLRRLDDEILERFVAPARVVAPTFDRLAPEERDEEVVRIAVVARPAERRDLMLAALRPLAIFRPFVSHELRLYADLLPIGLNHLGHALAVRVVRTRHRQIPQLELESVAKSRLRQQLLRLRGIV